MPILSIAPVNPTIDQGLGYAAMGFSIVFVMLLCLLIAIKVMVAVMGTMKKKEAAPAAAPAAAAPAANPNAGKVPAPGSLGEIAIHDVDEKTAAILMAIVADKMGAPLNELRFISIKKVD